MAEQKPSERFNKAVREEMDDAIRHRENPRIISLMRHLVRLTNTSEENAKLEAEEAAAMPQCPHENVQRSTGKCTSCGEVVKD